MVRCLLVGVLVVLGCGRPSASSPAPRPVHDEAGGFSSLDHVPADTPYLLAWLEALPDAMWERFLSGDLMKQSLAKARADLAMTPRRQQTGLQRLLVAYLEELDGDDILATLDRIGFGRDVRMTVYGLSVYPAVRAEVASSSRLRATIERILGAGGVAFEAGQIDDQPVLTSAAVGGHVFVLGFPSERGVVAGYFPVAEAPRYTRQLLGIDPPRSSLAGSGRLQAISAGGKPYMTGFVDFRALLRELGDGLSPTCREEAMALIGLAPSLEMIGAVRDEHWLSFTVRLVVDPPIAERIAALAVPVPGLTASPAGRPLMVAGIGLDLDELEALAVRAAAEVRARPFRCNTFAPLNQLAQDLIGGFVQYIPPPFDTLRGALLTLDGVDPVVARAIAIHDRPLDLLAMFAQVAPPLAAAGVRDDGTPVVVDLQALGIPGVDRATLVVDGTRLGVGVGVDSGAVTALVAANTPAGGPLALLGVDFERFLKVMGPDVFADQPELAAMMQAYGFFSYVLRADHRGLALDLTMEMK